MQEERFFKPIQKVIKGVMWQTETSLCLASTHDILGGKKLAERYLWRTPGGQYFESYHGSGIGGHLKSQNIEPLSQKDAVKRYAKYTWQHVPFAEAFPGAQQA